MTFLLWFSFNCISYRLKFVFIAIFFFQFLVFCPTVYFCFTTAADHFWPLALSNLTFTALINVQHKCHTFCLQIQHKMFVSLLVCLFIDKQFVVRPKDFNGFAATAIDRTWKHKHCWLSLLLLDLFVLLAVFDTFVQMCWAFIGYLQKVLYTDIWQLLCTSKKIICEKFD